MCLKCVWTTKIKEKKKNSEVKAEKTVKGSAC